MVILHCPVCHTRFDTETAPAMPFCSVRCQYLDLASWLNEEQGLPADLDVELPQEIDDDPPPPPPRLRR